MRTIDTRYMPSVGGVDLSIKVKLSMPTMSGTTRKTASILNPSTRNYATSSPASWARRCSKMNSA
jgi:hypothetical protein